MPGIVTRRFRYLNTDSFIEIFSSPTESVYFWIGKFINWPSTPPNPEDSVGDTNYEHWRTMFAMKRVTSADITRAIPRYDWVTGKTYRMYDDQDGNLYDAPSSANTFYVVNTTGDLYRVYKCIDNDYNAVSTVLPTTTSYTDIETTSDGYKWKYMYSLNIAETFKYVTTNYIPIKFVTVDDASDQWEIQQQAANGSIEVIKIDFSGSGYHYSKGVINSASGNQVVLNSVANTNNDVYNGSSIFLNNTVAEILNYDGASNTVTLDTSSLSGTGAGNTYVIGPTINIVGNGENAVAYANVNVINGQIGPLNRIIVVNPGQNYAWADVTVTANTSYGSGGISRAIMSPPGGHGSSAVYELGGHNAIISIEMAAGDEANNIAYGNEFNQYGLIYSPLYANGDLAEAVTIDTTDTVKVTGTNVKTALEGEFGAIEDALLTTDNGAKANVVRYNEIDSSNMVLYLANTYGDWVNSANLYSESNLYNLSEYSNSVIQRYTGDVLFVENRNPITRDADQTENIKFVIRF